MVHYWRLNSLVFLIYLSLLTYALDEDTMRAVRVMKTRQQRIRYLSAPSLNSQLSNLPLLALRSGSRLINRTTRFYRGKGSSALSQVTSNGVVSGAVPRNHSLTKTQNGDLSSINHRIVTPKVKAHGVIQQHETILLPQPNTEDTLREQLEKFKDKRIESSDQYLNANSIQEEIDLLRLVERTTMMINIFPSMKTTTSIPLIINNEFNATINNTNDGIESNLSPQSVDFDSSNIIPSALIASSNQVSPNMAPSNIAILTQANPSIVTPDLSAPDFISSHHSTFDLEDSPARKEAPNTSIPHQVNVRDFRPPSKRVLSLPAINQSNSTTHISAPQLSLTRFVMYPSQVPSNKIAPIIPNAAPLPPTTIVGGIQSSSLTNNNVKSMNSSATPSPNDDTLGCTWDFITNSCKDVFALNWCARCHDFGNVFLHNCKCLVKNTTPPIATFL